MLQSLLDGITGFFSSIFSPLFDFFSQIGTAFVSFINGTARGIIAAVTFVTEIVDNFLLFKNVPLPGLILTGMAVIMGIFAVKVVIDLL